MPDDLGEVASILPDYPETDDEASPAEIEKGLASFLEEPGLEKKAAAGAAKKKGRAKSKAPMAGSFKVVHKKQRGKEPFQFFFKGV